MRTITEAVREQLRLYKKETGLSTEQLAAKFGVSANMMWQVLSEANKRKTHPRIMRLSMSKIDTGLAACGLEAIVTFKRVQDEDCD